MKNVRTMTLAAVLLAAVTGAGAAVARADPAANESSSEARRVDAAKACSTEAAAVRDAYAALRDHLRSRADTARSEVLLGEAEDALLKARAACRDDAGMSRSFEQLAAENEQIRRALGAARP